eukprot:7498337-Alexandrium_andersonii.AAC.1
MNEEPTAPEGEKWIGGEGWEHGKQFGCAGPRAEPLRVGTLAYAPQAFPIALVWVYVHNGGLPCQHWCSRGVPLVPGITSKRRA